MYCPGQYSSFFDDKQRAHAHIRRIFGENYAMFEIVHINRKFVFILN
jgi:hypothetical protein